MRKILFIFSLLICHCLNASPKYDDVIVSEIRTIYDGDTFKVNIESWPDIIGKSISIRINGVDTPELRGKCQAEIDKARLAKQFTVQKLREAKTVELKNIQRGKYFRIVADVFVDEDSLGELLLSAGLARAYDGGKRLGWCNVDS